MIILFRKGNILFHRAILSIVNLNSIQCLTERPNSQPEVKQNTAHFKSVSMRKPGRTRQEVTQLKSPILLKRGTNVEFGE